MLCCIKYILLNLILPTALWTRYFHFADERPEPQRHKWSAQGPRAGQRLDHCHSESLSWVARRRGSIRAAQGLALSAHPCALDQRLHLPCPTCPVPCLKGPRGSPGSRADCCGPFLYPRPGPFRPPTVGTSVFSSTSSAAGLASPCRERPGGICCLQGGTWKRLRAGFRGWHVCQGTPCLASLCQQLPEGWRSSLCRSTGPRVSLDLSCFLGHFAQRIRRAPPISSCCPALTPYALDHYHPPSASLAPGSAYHMLSHWFPQEELMRQAPYYSHFACEEWCSERLTTFAWVTQLVNVRAGIWTQVSLTSKLTSFMLPYTDI